MATTFAELDLTTLASRIGMALLLGGAIGWNRQRAGKAAGLRTHMLISLGSCLFVLVPLSLNAPADALSRTIQGVASGVGFLGGGVILHQARSGDGPAIIKGLTSAAAIWATAALGIVAACGLWRTAGVAIGAALVVLTVAKRLERPMFDDRADNDQA
jgi:putative Mg2+ transporter-C (MgtC) family protein